MQGLDLNMNMGAPMKANVKAFDYTTDLPNKAVWLRSDIPAGYTVTDDGGVSRVSPIIDQSGLARNATNGTLAQRAITGTRTAKGLNTFDYVAAQASRYDMAGALLTLMQSANHAFFFALKPDITSGQRILVGSNGASPDWAVTFQENLVSFKCGSKDVNSPVVTDIMQISNMNILGVRRNGTTLDLWVNGVQYTNNTGTAITISLTHGPFLFHEFNSINEFDGQFGELIGTSDSPSDLLMVNTLNNLATKWRN